MYTCPSTGITVLDYVVVRHFVLLRKYIPQFLDLKKYYNVYFKFNDNFNQENYPYAVDHLTGLSLPFNAYIIVIIISNDQ